MPKTSSSITHTHLKLTPTKRLTQTHHGRKGVWAARGRAEGRALGTGSKGWAPWLPDGHQLSEEEGLENVDCFRKRTPLPQLPLLPLPASIPLLALSPPTRPRGPGTLNPTEMQADEGARRGGGVHSSGRGGVHREAVLLLLSALLHLRPEARADSCTLPFLLLDRVHLSPSRSPLSIHSV